MDNPRMPGAIPTPASNPNAPKIQHTRPGFGGGMTPPTSSGGGPGVEPSIRPMTQLSDEHVPMAEETEGPSTFAKRPITPFGSEKQHDEKWRRSPNTTGHGAIHVRTFHCKLTEDALNYMDQLINEWLDSHPQYEVKFVTSTIGTFTGKLKEPALICQVWV
ncbi:MAG TPA: hypothetical protein VG711_01675 [Phycisphaerales bacterium]|nr:hypothetical protein [Phycisphaerales bacterium]